MFRRTIIALSKAERTVVRDPRKKRLPAVVRTEDSHSQVPSNMVNRPPPPLPFQPSQQQQASLGSTLGTYVLLGVGVGLGVSLISALFGGF
jgi:hypothetical protein